MVNFLGLGFSSKKINEERKEEETIEKNKKAEPTNNLAKFISKTLTANTGVASRCKKKICASFDSE